jgi:GWxTD domain-containing protein
MNGIRRRRFGPLLVLLAAGLAACAGAGGPAVRLDAESEEFFRTTRLIMTGDENAIFNHLPDAAARREFIRDFWAKRDPDPDTPENEFRKMFQDRVEYANKHFNEGGPGYNTDRGRVYIFMGPPDKVEEFFTHGDPEVRGQIVWWLYYKYELGIEFADERGYGSFKIRRYEGNFFEAMEGMKLGQLVGPADVFKKAVVPFKLRYDEAGPGLAVTIPADAVSFRDEDGTLRADFDFAFYLYLDEGVRQETFTASRTFTTTDAELAGLKDIPFAFERRLPPGTHFVDVLIKAAGGEGRVRRIFKVKVK